MSKSFYKAIKTQKKKGKENVWMWKNKTFLQKNDINIVKNFSKC